MCRQPSVQNRGCGPSGWAPLGLHVSASGRFQSRETHPQTIRGPCPAQPGAHTALSSLLPPSQPLGLPSPVVVVMGQGAACHRWMPVYLGSPTWSAQSALPEARPLERSCWACPLRGRPGCSEKCSEQCSAPEGRFLWPFHIVLVCFPLKPCNSCNPCPARQPVPPAGACHGPEELVPGGVAPVTAPGSASRHRLPCCARGPLPALFQAATAAAGQ